MAGIAVSAVLKVASEKLSSEALKEFLRFYGIRSELKKWERTLTLIQALLNDASQKEITNEVKPWVNSLEHLAYDIDDVLDDLTTEVMHYKLNEESDGIISKVSKLVLTCCMNLSISIRMRDKINKITTELQDLEKEKQTFGLTVTRYERPRNTTRKFQTSMVDASSIVGRQSDKEALLHKLLGGEPCNQNYSIVPIVGMGGVGKTALANLLYYEKEVRDHFELKAWVCVSGEFNVKNISTAIYECVIPERKKFKNLDMLQVALKEQLMGKRFLLVLDDIWSENEEDWENLVGPFHACAPGSKVIMTTRSEKLLNKLGYDHLNHLQSLSDDDALCLLARHARNESNFDSFPTLKPHAEGIVKKCDGLPLALRALGRLLKTKIYEEEWENVLNSEIWRLEEGSGVIAALRLSYHDLSSCLMRLFAYCSLFPKGYVFDKEDLILLWMAEGFLEDKSSLLTKEDLGHEYFEELLSRSFFQHAPNEESLFVMHNLTNDLATYVAGDLFLRLDVNKDVTNEAFKKYRHMSFIRNNYSAYTKLKAFKGVKCLRTLLSVKVSSWQRFFLSNKILDELLYELPLLRVLCLSDYEISEVPESIGSLKHLRYLNLSKTHITHLPENVCDLCNLETLIVFGCLKLSKLPNSFSNLKKLRHLDIKDTPLLNKMPLGIADLKSLQTLSKIIIEGENGFAITDLIGLQNLHGKISIKGLEKVENAMQARQANLLEKRFSELEVEWSDMFDGSRNESLEKEVLNVLKPRNRNLGKLKVVSYGGKEFPNWVGDPTFLHLEHVSIHGCRNCPFLPLLGQLPSLKKLFIEDMNGVKNVGSELLGTGHAFPSLNILSFSNMEEWGVWSTKRGVVVDAVFPCLQELVISDCPKLVEISLEALPSLRVLKVDTCGYCVVRSLVHVASSLIKLDIHSISGLTYEVWSGVMMHLGSVEEVKIMHCENINYFWESDAHASKVLINLRKLTIWNCSNLESLAEKEDVNCESNLLTSLRMLDIRFCVNMWSCICPNNIETLTIISCRSLLRVSFPTKAQGGENLKSLSILNCTNLLERELGGENSFASHLIKNRSLQKLKNVSISGWPILKSVFEWTYFNHLTVLRIESCPRIESFPDHELPNLPLLKNLTISDCPSMDASFPRGLWPPKLQILSIGRLKKPISEWGPQYFPTSLVELILLGGPSEVDEVTSSSQLSHLLPSSLTTLRIVGFEKLESVSIGLEHLAFLQELYLASCVKLKYLPDKLFPSDTVFPSLTVFTVLGCPILKERCSGRGSYYWPRISRIHCIMMDWVLQY